MKGINKEMQQKIFFYFLNHKIFLTSSAIRGNLSVPMDKSDINLFLNVFEDFLKDLNIT